MLFYKTLILIIHSCLYSTEPKDICLFVYFPLTIKRNGFPKKDKSVDTGLRVVA